MADRVNTQAAKEQRAESRLAALMKGRRQEVARPIVIRLSQGPGQPTLPVEAQFMILSCTEIQWCHAHAHHRFTDVLKLDPAALENRVLFEDEVVVQVLARALRTREDIAVTLAESPDDLRDHTTAAERAAAFEQFYDYQQSIDPSTSGMTDELALQIEALLKKKDAARLGDFGSSLLVSWLLFMESRQLISPIPRSGPTESSPPAPETV